MSIGTGTALRPDPDTIPTQEAISNSAKHAGRIVAVWGPHGAPGRTTVAAHLAQALVPDGPVLLIDADTVAPAMAAHFGLAVGRPGNSVSGRYLDADAVDERLLREEVFTLEAGFDLLTDLVLGQQVDGVTVHGLECLLSLAARHYRWVVVDVGADAGADPQQTPVAGRATPNIATRTVLRGADSCLALVAADALSIQRFVLHHAEIKELVADFHVVATKVRRRAPGTSSAEAVRRTVERFTGLMPCAELPWTAPALDRAWLRAQKPSALSVDHEYTAAFAGVVAVVKGERAVPRRVRRPVPSWAGKVRGRFGWAS